MPLTKVYVADAGSTDGTPDLVMGFSGRLNVEVIPGGFALSRHNIDENSTLDQVMLRLRGHW